MVNILIIDQDKRFTDLLEEYLKLQGFMVRVARKGDDGMVQALKQKPDLIIMDAIMPDLTGFQMCNRFRENPQTMTVPIVMMSNLALFPNQQLYALERGANAHIPKPTQVVELGEWVDKYTMPKGEKKPAPPPLPLEKEKIPFARPQYTLSTDIHRRLSPWLSEALDREKAAAEPSEPPTPSKKDI